MTESSRARQEQGITDARLYRPGKERSAVANLTEQGAKNAIAEKIAALKKNYEDRNARKEERGRLQSQLEDVQSTLPTEGNVLGKLTGLLKKETREGWAHAAATQNQLATLDKAIRQLKTSYDVLKGEIDDIVLSLVKGEALWRKASTVERFVIQLKVDVREYKKMVDAVHHRANGILLEKGESTFPSQDDEGREMDASENSSYMQELSLLLRQAYAAGDAFLKTFNEYYTAMEKPPPWKVEIPIGKNVRITLDLVQNKEMLTLYTPESLRALEERLGFLSERLAIARKEITARIKEIRTEKNKYFHRKKTSLSTHFA